MPTTHPLRRVVAVVAALALTGCIGPLVDTSPEGLGEHEPSPVPLDDQLPPVQVERPEDTTVGSADSLDPYVIVANGAQLNIHETATGEVLVNLDPDRHDLDYEIVDIDVHPQSTLDEGMLTYTAAHGRAGGGGMQVRALQWIRSAVPTQARTVSNVVTDLTVTGEEPSGALFGTMGELLVLDGFELTRHGMRDDGTFAPSGTVTLDLPDTATYRIEDFTSTAVSEGTAMLLLTGSDLTAWKVTFPSYGFFNGGFTPDATEQLPAEAGWAIVDLGFTDGRPDQIVRLQVSLTETSPTPYQVINHNDLITAQFTAETDRTGHAAMVTSGSGAAWRQHEVHTAGLVDLTADEGLVTHFQHVSAIAWMP